MDPSPAPARRPLLCRLGFHRYDRQENDDGEAYLRCRRCHRLEFPSVGLSHGGDAML